MSAPKASLPSLASKVDHLCRPGAYSAAPAAVETRETHMSWVFLAGGLAYKLKKPIRSEHFDWRTVAARRADCEREVVLNRRLAPDVYHGVVPLAAEDGGLRLEGAGEPVDWLVKMRRLPEALMLDGMIERGEAEPERVGSAVDLLARFYRRSPAFPIAPRRYRRHLIEELEQSRRELLLPRYGQAPELVRRVHAALLAFVAREGTLLEGRVRAGRVIDAHGDLRPEHVCLEAPPVVIDCLQFAERLRILDTASELSFLTLECERLGAGGLAETIWSVYGAICDDRPPAQLLRFYRAYHACLRAMVSVWHLRDPVPDPGRWTDKAHRYLETADEQTGTC